MALKLFVIYRFNLLNTCFHSNGETSLRMGNPRVHPSTLGCIQFQILNSSVITNSLFKCVTNQEQISYIYFLFVCVCVYVSWVSMYVVYTLWKYLDMLCKKSWTLQA